MKIKDKVIQVVANQANNIIALTEAGEIYIGFFANVKDPFEKPKFGWRRAPPIVDETYTYVREKEASLEQLEKDRAEWHEALKRGEEAQRKTQAEMLEAKRKKS